MTPLEESIRNFRQPVYAAIKRGTEKDRATEEYVIANLERLVTLFSTIENDQHTSRMIRDDIDSALRRYHRYCVKERIGAHYFETDMDEKGVFEHMIPNSTICDMLVHGAITAKQACHMPTCRLSKANDALLVDNGWNSKTPDIYNFWKRYEYCFDVVGKFITWDGAPVKANMTLDEHFDRYIL